MTKSSVVDNETGKSIDSTVRTSTGTFFARGQDPVLAAVEKRIAQVSVSQNRNSTMTWLQGVLLQFPRMLFWDAHASVIASHSSFLLDLRNGAKGRDP